MTTSGDCWRCWVFQLTNMFASTNATKCLAACFLAGLLAACGGDGSTQYQYDPTAAVHPAFSGDHAYEHVQKLVEFGPRPAGSNALEKSRVYIEEQLKELGWEVIRQSFTDKAPNGASIDFVNLRARFGNPDDVTFWDQKRAILLGSHYDTKRFKDIEFVGANDGGSSTGALIEIARAAAKKPDFAEQIELVFFDGEEAFERSITPTDGLYGSRHYALNITRRQKDLELRPEAVVILDMVGEKDLSIRLPSDTPPHLAKALFAAAEELGQRDKFGLWSTKITDDHVPFQNEGVPAIDLIDFDFRAWHTSRDKMDQISADSLQISGQTTLLFIEKYLLGGAGENE